MSRFPDTRTLLLIVLCFTTLALALGDPFWLAAVLALALAALAAMGISPARLGRRLKRYRGLFLVLVLAQSLTNSSGRVFLEWRGHVLLSSGGVQAAAAAVLRIAVILAAAMFLSRRNYQELVTALVQLRVPYELAYMVLLGVRFIPVFMEEFRTALTAIQLRGVDLDKVPLGRKIRIYSYILMPAVAGALIRARRVAVAMEARAFRARPRRTWLEWPRLHRRDWLLMAAAVTATAAVLVLYWR